MKTPIWAYITGIFMILFGVYEAQSGLELISDLRTLDMIGNISGINFTEKFNLSDLEVTWIIRFAYIGLLVWFIFIIGGIFLLIKKGFSIKLAYVAIASSILFFIIQCVMFNPSNSVLFGLLVVVVLLIVLLASDKTAFCTEEEFQE
jgi:hypothetical protein